MRYVRVSRAESVQDTDKELIKVNGDIHESKRFNVVFNILHVFCNGPITLLRTSKILAMDNDPSMGVRGMSSQG